LGIAHEAAKDLDATLTAFDRAIALQPETAMWRRNRAGTLIDLGRLDDATDEIAAARALEPDAPRLAELDQALQQARANAATNADL
jgi:tetratricopeptide (TPR) repeat protein